MGAKFTKLRKDSDEESRTDSGSPMTKAIAVLLYSEIYSEDESDAVSTPSCCSVDDAGDQRLEWIEEISALQDLEEKMMQAKASEDVKQAKMQRKLPIPSLWSETSNDSIISPPPKSSDGSEGKQKKSVKDVAALRQSTSTGKKKFKGRHCTGSDTSSRKSSTVTLGENGGSKNKPGIQLK